LKPTHSRAACGRHGLLLRRLGYSRYLVFMGSGPGTHFKLIGRGVYSLAEASRITNIPSSRIRRWAKGDHDGRRLDIVSSQFGFEAVISPMLYRGIEFDDVAEPERWWPFGDDRSVVIDPRRRLGAPIAAKGGVPTRVRFGAFVAEGDLKLVAGIYEADLPEVEDAIMCEDALAA